MTTQANIGRWKFRKATTGSPATFNPLEEVISIDNVGVLAADLDVTNFDSPEGYKEFISDLKEGQEVSVTCNWYPAATQQLAMIAAVDAGVNINFQLAYIGVSPEDTWTFVGSPKGYVFNPSATQQNQITFTVKISGEITAA